MNLLYKIKEPVQSFKSTKKTNTLTGNSNRGQISAWLSLTQAWDLWCIEKKKKKIWYLQTYGKIKCSLTSKGVGDESYALR